MDHVNACRRRFLKNMEDEVKGFQVETCFGPGGCPNRAVVDDALSDDLEAILSELSLKAFLKEHVQGPLKMHHEFRVSVSDCPNACSRPQITDIGLIGAHKPKHSGRECDGCGACIEICREQALELSSEGRPPEISDDRCLGCGQCVAVCPVVALESGDRGYRILLGGKLGRHPQLGRELSGVFSREKTIEIVKKCLDFYMAENKCGERFGEILNRVDDHFFDDLT
jgi:dissimilatory sulfite reductase (desulfoviridin) alpha/beta subunit